MVDDDDSLKAESLLRIESNNSNNNNSNSNSNNNNSNNNTEGAEGENEEEPSFSEFRIQVGGNTVSPSNYYKGIDFRNHDTGESILPTEVYMNLFRQVFGVRNGAQQKTCLLFIVLYMFVMTGPISDLNTTLFIALNDDDKSTGSYMAIVVGVLVSATMMALAWKIGNFFLERIYKTLDSQAQQLVNEKHDELLESYGIEIGYQKCKTSFTSSSMMKRYVNDDSYVWLRRPRQAVAVAAATAAAATSSSSLSPPPPKEFPLIYICALVPGDIHINEEVYHSSMGFDEQTWKLIQKTHKEMLQKHNPFMNRLAIVLFLILIPYAFGSAFIAYHIGFAAYWTGFLLYFCVLYYFFQWVERRHKQVQQLVAETVTGILNNNSNNNNKTTGYSKYKDDEDRMMLKDDPDLVSEEEYTFNPSLVGYSLIWQDSPPLEGRRTSTRYQLVRTTNTSDSQKRADDEDDNDTTTSHSSQEEEEEIRLEHSSPLEIL